MNKRTAFVFFLLAVVTYSENIKPILDGHCIECHDSGSDLDLSQYPFVCNNIPDQPSIVGKMLEKLGANPPAMPPGNRPKLSSDEVNLIQQWKEQGLQK